MALRTIATLIGVGMITSSMIQDGAVGAADLAADSSRYYVVANAATSGNITNMSSAAPNSVDGYNLQAGDVVLVRAQTTASQNGLYTVDTVGSGSDGQWSRLTSRDETSELPLGLLVYASAGVSNKGLYKLSAFNGTVGTDAMTFDLQDNLSPMNGGEPIQFTGDGSDLSFDMPVSGSVQFATVSVDGIVQDPGNWHISHGTGAAGVDQLIFETGNAPANNAKVEIAALKRV